VPDVARIVNEDVEVAEALEAGGDGAIAELLRGHVTWERLANAAESGDVRREALQARGIEIVGEHAAAFRDQLADDGPADPLPRTGDERHSAIEPARAHRSLPAHSSMPSIMIPLAAFGWISQRAWVADPTGGRSMIGRDRSASERPLAATSSLTSAR